jgi:hypothetical protein
MERVQELHDNFRAAIAVEIDHLEFEMGGNAVGFLGGAHVVGQGVDDSGLNVERGLVRAGHRGDCESRECEKGKKRFHGLGLHVGPPHAANRRQGEARDWTGRAPEGPE